MSRPLLLDLFCGAGGAAMGYHRAGFDVVGVDIKPQPHYPFACLVGDALIALEQLIAGKLVTHKRIDALHASPPCEHYAAVTRWRGKADNHPDLVGPTRDLLNATGLPWVMENVREAELHDPMVLCGSMFGLRVRRHRYFETNWMPFEMVTSCRHDRLLPFEHKGERAYADAMGCDWMSSKAARKAIPPAYTTFIGTRLLAHLEKAA